MAKRLLVIDRDDQGRFFLSVEGDTLTVGASVDEMDVVLRELHITRLRCEVEVAEGPVFAADPFAEGEPQEFRPGTILHAGQSHIRFEAAEPISTPTQPPAPVAAPAPIAALVPAPAAVPAFDEMPELALEGEAQSPEAPRSPAASEAAPAAAAEATKLRFRFRVVDGADQGRLFTVPEGGLATIGKSHKHADIVLNDLYVARVHCELSIEVDHLVARHLEGQNGTLINNERITKKELFPGEILRVGNSHLLLETFEETEAPPVKGATPAAEEAEAIEEIGCELVEEEAETAADQTGVDRAEAAANPFVLPHSPVDELLQLEDKSLGHFKIGTLLGRGQSGLVFKAQDQKTKLHVALKVLAADFPASDVELQRFGKALKMASTLQHPALIGVIAAGKSGAYCWISREYVEGESLTRRIRRLKEGGKLDWKGACRLAVHLAGLLDFLHRNKVTHGNITPRNVLIRASDQMTKLADLMLNRALEGSKLQKSILGKKLLTELPFMAPEQTDPHAPVTPLGDIYALGVVLYALLTGDAPFMGHTPKEVLAQVRQAKVVRPSKLQKGIPTPLETAVLMMMARQPENRFPTAAEALAAVAAVAEEHGVEID